MAEKELQRKYMQLQVLRQQMATMLEEKVLLDEKINEVSMTIDALKKLGGVKDGEEMWSSLGSGAFVRADIKDTEKVIVGIGAGAFAKKTAADAAETLQARLEELKQLDSQFTAEINKVNRQVLMLEPEIEKAAHAKQ